MEEDNEVLDWGNEEDEQQHHYSDTHRAQKGSDFFEARRGSGDVDDAEDAVSLGGDDDEQDYYSYQRQDSNGNNSNTKSGGLPLTPKSTTFAQQQAQHHSATPRSQSHSSRDLRRENSSNSQKHITGSGSSPQTTSSSPQRSKIMHALPPKPVVANVPFLHPSHPSIIEATAMSRSTGRDSKSKANGSIAGVGPSGKPMSSGDSNTANNASSDSSLPPDWEVRHPRTGGRSIYYYNVRTHQSTWTRPASSSSSNEPTSGARDRRNSGSTAVGGRLTFDSSVVPAKSDNQPLSSTRSARPPLDFDSGDSQKQPVQTVTPSLTSTATLSYEDRHYRPAGGDTTNASDNSNPNFGFNSNSNKRELDSRYVPQQAFTPSASPQHERFRSLSRSPPPQRVRDSARQSHATQRPGRGQYAQLQTESSSQRERDTPRLYSPASPGRHWDSLPVEIKVNNDTHPASSSLRRQHRQNQQQQRQQQQQQDADVDQLFDSFEDRDRPITRNSRGRNQHREQSHSSGEQARIHEQQNQSQTQNVSAPSNRSPPSHLRRREYDYDAEGESLSVQMSTSANSATAFTPDFVAKTPSAPVHKQRERPSRFDRPAAPVPASVPASAQTPAPAPFPITNRIDANAKDEISHTQHSRSSRNHDVYVPADISIIPMRRGERDRDELTSSAQISGGDTNALLINKRLRPPLDERGDHTPLPPSERRATVTRRPGAGSTAPDISPPPPEPQSQERGPGQSRRKRQPLPPQSLRFREMSSRPKADQSFNQNQTYSPTQGMILRPLGPDDQQQRPTNSNTNNSSVPSGPRSQPQSHIPPQQPARETGHPDSARGLRIPSGPSGDVDKRGDRRAPVALTLPNEMEIDMDVDNLPSSRVPSSSKSNDIPIRAGSGMYADREATDLPKGPRAMASKASAPTSGPMINATSSPTTLFMHHGGGGGRARERSPPPHMMGNNDGWGEYSGHRVVGVSASTAKQDTTPAWRGQDQQVRQNSGHHPMERGQGRREPPQQRGRQNETSHPQQSGTSSVPVANKNNHLSGVGNSVEGAPPGRYGSSIVPPPGMSSANMEPMRNNRSRGDSQLTKESYDRPPPYNPRVSNADSYRPSLLEGAGTTQHRRSNTGRTPPPLIFERDPPSPVDAFVPPRRGRRDPPEEQTRFDQPPSQGPMRTSAPRNWRPRSLSPSRELIPHTGFNEDDNYRVVTPPLSREPSLVSPSWEIRSFTSDRGRPTSRYSDSLRQHRSDGLRGEPMDMDSRHRPQLQDDLLDRGRERFSSVAEHHRGGSLEGRLGERYEDRYVEPPHQTHGLPPNPSLRRDRDTYASEPTQQRRPEGRRHSRSFSAERMNPGWVDQGRPPSPNRHIQLHPSHERAFDAPPKFSTSDRDAPSRTSKPVRIRRPGSMSQSRQEEHVRSEPMIDNLSVHAHQKERGGDNLEAAPQQRPLTLRRGASLLDRLSLDHGTDPSAGSMTSPSLRERVQIPAKRDRDVMLGGDDRNSMDPPFDGEEGAGGDPTAKRSRRRSGKPRRGRRGNS